MIEVYVFLAVTLVCAYFAVSSKNIVYGVVFLLCTNLSLGVVYFMMGAPTVALFQIAIFAGAVVVFFIVAVMFTQAGKMMTDEVEEEVQE